MFQMRANGLSKNRLLEVLAFPDQVLYRMPVTDLHHVLGDDGPLIQCGSHIVGGGTDHFHPPSVSLMVGASTGKGRQKAVMNIDDRHSGLFEKPSA